MTLLIKSFNLEFKYSAADNEERLRGSSLKHSGGAYSHVGCGFVAQICSRQIHTGIRRRRGLEIGLREASAVAGREFIAKMHFLILTLFRGKIPCKAYGETLFNKLRPVSNG